MKEESPSLLFAWSSRALYAAKLGGKIRVVIT